MHTFQILRGALRYSQLGINYNIFSMGLDNQKKSSHHSKANSIFFPMALYFQTPSNVTDADDWHSHNGYGILVSLP